MAPCKNVKGCICKKSAYDRFKHFKPIFDEICASDAANIQKIIANAPSCFVRLISELGLNILKGSIKLPKHQYKKLRPHKRLLIRMSKPGFSPEHHRQILLKKRGGFLPAILPLILSAVSGFAGQTLAKTLF